MANSPVKVEDQAAPDHQEMVDRVQYILEKAVELGATQAEAGVSVESGLSATVRLGEIETLEYHRDQGMGVTVYFGKRKGVASTSAFDAKALDETVAAACDIARYTAEDECAGLADAALMARDYPDLDLHHPWQIDAPAAIDIGKRCEQAARDADKRISNSEGATVSSHDAWSLYGNTHDFIGGYARSRHSISCAVIGDIDGAMQRDYWYTVSRKSGNLEDPEAVGRRAAERTVQRLGARKLETQQAPVIFQAEVATGLFGHFISAIRGGSLYRRSSFLLDALDTQVFPEFIRLEEQPHLRAGLGSAPFDREGVLTRQRDIVTDGVLKGYALSSYSGCKLGMETTANAGGVRNVSVHAGKQPTFDELLSGMGTGLLVTELMGQGVKLVTGDYSRGASGFWVENGEIQYPVEEITIAGNLRDMFMAIEAVANDIDTRGNIQTGSVLIGNMTIAGD